MKVNILLSTYNGEQYLKEQVESIQQQTYQNWQLFIRDDGSSDGSVTIKVDMDGSNAQSGVSKLKALFGGLEN
ncbi:glycosyltransferase, partial [Streptococcus gordonii]|uniref:glycosyltransferase n=1 Tax=Streptococcus gordonii TaxID=1302 RepID=UPI001CC0B006